MRRRLLGACLAAAALAFGCAADKPKPAKLTDFIPSIKGSQVWSARVAGVHFPIQPTARDGVFYVGGDDGSVLALDAQTGAVRWHAKAGAALAAGVGSDGRFASVVTTDNELVTFDRGREIWHKRLESGAATAPYVAGERVFLMTIDRAVYGFDAHDGQRLWALQRPGDPLTLEQGGVLGAFRNSLLVGQGPRLAAVDPLRGTVQWEVALASPRGANEVERLADLVGPALVLGDRICARAFQAGVGCANAASGELVWSRKAGGTQAVGGNAERLFGADASDRISAWRTRDGEPLWTSDKLLYRGLGGALATGRSVVFGDSQGYVHFLAQSDGELQLRLPTDGSAVVGTPVQSGSTILVVTRKGGLFAFRIS